MWGLLIFSFNIKPRKKIKNSPHKNHKRLAMEILVATGTSNPHSIRNAKRTPSRTPMPSGAKMTRIHNDVPIAKVKPHLEIKEHGPKNQFQTSITTIFENTPVIFFRVYYFIFYRTLIVIYKAKRLYKQSIFLFGYVINFIFNLLLI